MSLKRLRLPASIFIAYAWLFPWMPALRSPNELSRVYQMRAVVDDGTLAIDGQLKAAGPIGDLSVKDGRHYPNKAPGISLAGVPLYGVLKVIWPGKVTERALVFFARLFLCMLPAALAALAMRRLLRRYLPPDSAAAGALIFALGTLMWPYSTLLMGHGATTAALVACWYCLARARGTVSLPLAEIDPTLDRLHLLAGLAAGGAVLIEYTSALMLAPLLAYGLATVPRDRSRVRSLLVAGAGALPAVVVLAVYHQVAFGSPFQTGYSFLENPTFAAWHARGFMGVGAPRLDALWASFLSPQRGLFFYAPFLILALPGLGLLYRQDRAEGLLCIFALFFYVLFAAGFPLEAWGWSVGPRHLTPLCAFLMPPAALAADWLRERNWGIVPTLLAMLSFITMALVVAVCPYLPEELTRPVHQLVMPLLRRGYHVHDLLSMAVGVASPWTVIPWTMWMLQVIRPATVAFLSGSRLYRRRQQLAVACLGALAAFWLWGQSGTAVKVDETWKFMLDKYEPKRGRPAPGLGTPP